MKKNLDLIEKSFKQSIKDYDVFSKSKHWNDFNSKKKNLFEVNNFSASVLLRYLFYGIYRVDRLAD